MKKTEIAGRRIGESIIDISGLMNNKTALKFLNAVKGVIDDEYDRRVHKKKSKRKSKKTKQYRLY